MTKERDRKIAEAVRDAYVWEGTGLQMPFLDLSAILATIPPEPVRVPDEWIRFKECAERLVQHADFQLGGVLSPKSKVRDIPSRAGSMVKARHLAALRDAIAMLGASPQPEAQQPAQALTDELIFSALVETMEIALAEDGCALKPPTFDEFMEDEYAAGSRKFITRLARAIESRLK